MHIYIYIYTRVRPCISIHFLFDRVKSWSILVASSVVWIVIADVISIVISVGISQVMSGQRDRFQCSRVNSEQLDGFEFLREISEQPDRFNCVRLISEQLGRCKCLGMISEQLRAGSDGKHRVCMSDGKHRVCMADGTCVSIWHCVEFDGVK